MLKVGLLIIPSIPNPLAKPCEKVVLPAPNCPLKVITSLTKEN